MLNLRTQPVTSCYIFTACLSQSCDLQVDGDLAPPVGGHYIASERQLIATIILEKPTVRLNILWGLSGWLYNTSAWPEVCRYKTHFVENGQILFKKCNEVDVHFRSRPSGHTGLLALCVATFYQAQTCFQSRVLIASKPVSQRYYIISQIALNITNFLKHHLRRYKWVKPATFAF